MADKVKWSDVYYYHDAVECPLCHETITDMWEYFLDDYDNISVADIQCPSCGCDICLRQNVSIIHEVGVKPDA